MESKWPGPNGETTKAARRQASLSLFTSHYKEDFLFRTLGDLIRKPDVALGDLVGERMGCRARRTKESQPPPA